MSSSKAPPSKVAQAWATLGLSGGSGAAADADDAPSAASSGEVQQAARTSSGGGGGDGAAAGWIGRFAFGAPSSAAEGADADATAAKEVSHSTSWLGRFGIFRPADGDGDGGGTKGDSEEGTSVWKSMTIRYVYPRRAWLRMRALRAPACEGTAHAR